MFAQDVMDQLIRTGPQDPCGRLMRRYWQPVALSEEVDNKAPLPLTILGEDYVAFRNADGVPGLMARLCAHRGADLSYGVCEPEGLRCLYHGWKYDVTGQCVEQPGEPDIMEFRSFIRALTVPPSGTEGVVDTAPPRTLFIWPEVITVETVVTDVEFQYRQVAIDGRVLVYAATVTFEEILDVRVTSEELREEV